MEVSCATSFDERFDPANVLTSDNKTYWISTGLYPQEITFTLPNAKVVNEVKFVTTGARKIVIEGCPTATGNAFKVIGESKGKLFFFILHSRAWRQNWRITNRDHKNLAAFSQRNDEIYYIGWVGRFYFGSQCSFQLILNLKTV